MMPIITNYEYDLKLIDVIEGKKYEKNINDENQQFKYTNIQYSLSYKYSPCMINQLNILTCYLPLKACMISYNHNFPTIAFSVVNEKKMFSDKINEILEHIKTEIIKKHGESVTFDFPHGSNLDTYKICLRSFTKNKETRNTCQIHFHQSKSKGQNLITINNDTIHETLKIVNNEMPLFKHKLYMKKIYDHKDIHYVGKFLLKFACEVSLYENDEQNIKIICSVRLIANEVEIKHNVSYCNSILTKDLVKIDVHDERVTTLTI